MQILNTLRVQIGALEYDPEIPSQQRHREFLRDMVLFKEVVPIKKAILRSKIHQTYRMGYVKDVILPRVLDDTTFSTLSSMMLFNNVDVSISSLFLPMLCPLLHQQASKDACELFTKDEELG